MPLGDPMYLKVDDDQVGVFDVSPEAAYYWGQVAEGRIVVRHCRDCGFHSHPRQATCVKCYSRALDWAPSDGRGSVYTFSTVHRAKDPALTVPYTVGLVELADVGVYLFGQILASEDVAIGAPVVPEFADSPVGTLLNFRVTGPETRGE